MEVYRYPGMTLPSAERALALGSFEGLHIGHRAVICQAAGVKSLRAAVLTFSGNLPKADAGRLMSDARRDSLLSHMGIDERIVLDFEAVRNLTPEEFVRDVLKDRLNVRLCTCGFNFRFGKNGAGDVTTLQNLGEQYGIRVIAVDPIEVDGDAVSTSRIRRCLAEGDMAGANRLLGFPYTLDFEVVHGRGLGKTLGTPTINQPLPKDFTLPRFGVYASVVVADGKMTYGVTNIGVKPTVGSEAPIAETWIPTYEGDLYGQAVRVMPIGFLRDEQRFESLDDLQNQIKEDGEKARRLVLGEPTGEIKAVLFDFDDTLQDRALAFWRYTEEFFDTYFPALDETERRRRQEQMVVEQKGGYVDYVAYFRSLKEDWGWQDGPTPEELTTECRYRFSMHTALYPDALSVLRECRRRGYKVGIITNGLRLLQNRKLDICGIRSLLDLSLVSGDEGVHKPDPELFCRAAALMGVSPADCIYVGDHPVNDVRGALAAGMTPVYIYQSDLWGTPPDGVLQIDDISQLFSVL